MPCDFLNALRNDSFTKSIVNFLKSQWENKLTAEGLKGIKLYLSFDGKCYCYSIKNKELSCIEALDIKTHILYFVARKPGSIFTNFSDFLQTL